MEEHEKGREAFESEEHYRLHSLRHSTAHVMAQAVMRLHPEAKLAIGPAIEDGFYYDIDLPQPLREEDLSAIEAEMKRIVKENQSFDHEEWSREQAEAFFRQQGQTFKLELIAGFEDPTVSIYKNVPKKGGEPFVDLCKGPHVLRTGQCKHFKLLKVAGAYWRGDARGPQLQRIYGTVWPNREQLDQHLYRLEEAKKRDHRKLGRELDLFMFHDLAPGAAFWLPKGESLYHTLSERMRLLLAGEGYEVVRTPQVFDKHLWEVSGHWAHYRDNMFFFEDTHLPPDEQPAEPAPSEERPPHDALLLELRDALQYFRGLGDHVGRDFFEQKWRSRNGAPTDATERRRLVEALIEARRVVLDEGGPYPTLAPARHEVTSGVLGLKPMNCPSHMLIFRHRKHSYRDLPRRIHDQGVLHRNELSGVLSGLTRVRQFCQDDAHIFCTEEQIASEVGRLLDLVDKVYGALDLGYQVNLSTRPDEKLGDDDLWDRAEGALREALDSRGLDYRVNEGDGAFYGPKIDFDVLDALGRAFQCATLQLDFQLPQRFELSYVGADNQAHTPVVIHRAIFGSFERFLGILIEHFAGAFPVWLAPEQVRVLTVSEKSLAHGRRVHEALTAAGLKAVLDDGDEKIGYKIRLWHRAKVPYALIIGEREQEEGTVSVRTRDHGDLGSLPVDDLVARVADEARPRF